MRTAKKVLLSILLVLLIAALLYITACRYLAQQPQSGAKPTPAPTPEAVEPTPTPTPEPTEPEEQPTPDEQTPAPSPEPTPSGETVRAKLAVAGDIVVHDGLNAEAKRGDGSYDYEALLGGAADCVREADYAAATLETTFADTEAYSGYPLFRSPDSLAAGLRALGFDLINTGSEHCMDSGTDGLCRTLDVLEENALAHVGTCRTQDERDAANGITFADVNGIRIAFLSFTCAANEAFAEEAPPFAVNLLCRDGADGQREIDCEKLDADMAAARESGADVIAVFMHWGTENQTAPDREQRALADHLFEQGADLILGGHTHVPQPMELRQVTDRNGKEKTGYVCFSLGNLVSCQTDLYTNLTAVVNIELEKDLGSGETVIRSVRYVPLFMMNRRDYGVTDGGWRYRLLDLRAVLDARAEGEVDYTEPMYRSMEEGLEDLRGILGAQFEAGEEQSGDARTDVPDGT